MPDRQSATATVAAWAAYASASVIDGDIRDVLSFTVVGAIAAAFVTVGFAAASRCRPMPTRVAEEHARLLLLSVVCGAALGLFNLLANVALAYADPALRRLMVDRITQVPPIVALVSAPLSEEVTLRLFFMSVVAWFVSRVISRPVLIFGIAAGVSAVTFAAFHLNRAFPADATVAALYAGGLMLKYSVAGLALGAVFWRWGLPYAMVCHCLVNATHLALQSRSF
jgi:hypothetical protein